MWLLTQIASGICWVLYGSLFEWYWHKLWMHTPRFPKAAFEGHTVVHHGIYRGDQSYFLPEGDHPEHILLKPYSLPLIVLAHLPLILAIEKWIVPHTAIGGVAAILLYFVVYEYLHWNMHVPRGHFVERFGWFQFLRQHHKLHHRYMQKNFCVLFPLADWIFGTMITEKSLAKRKREREMAIATGQSIPDRRGRRRGRRTVAPLRLTRLLKVSPLARRLAALEARRARRSRKDRKRHDLGELMALLKSRRDRD